MSGALSVSVFQAVMQAIANVAPEKGELLHEAGIDDTVAGNDRLEKMDDQDLRNLFEDTAQGGDHEQIIYRRNYRNHVARFTDVTQILLRLKGEIKKRYTPWKQIKFMFPPGGVKQQKKPRGTFRGPPS